MTREESIAAAITEGVEIYDEVTTSDLQGIVMARAMTIVREHGGDQEDTENDILEAIYDTIATRETGEEL